MHDAVWNDRVDVVKLLIEEHKMSACLIGGTVRA